MLSTDMMIFKYRPFSQRRRVCNGLAPPRSVDAALAPSNNLKAALSATIDKHFPTFGFRLIGVANGTSGTDKWL
jgi:hypothetical protein